MELFNNSLSLLLHYFLYRKIMSFCMLKKNIFKEIVQTIEMGYLTKYFQLASTAKFRHANW